LTLILAPAYINVAILLVGTASVYAILDYGTAGFRLSWGPESPAPASAAGWGHQIDG
jgi:hypothetical protein